MTPEQLATSQEETRRRIADASHDMARHDVAAHAAGFAPDRTNIERPVGRYGAWHRVGPIGFDPFAVLAHIANAIADRAEMVLPSAPLSESLPLMMALAQNDGSLAAQSELLAQMKRCAGDRMTADEAMAAGDMVTRAGDAEMLAADTSTLVVPEAPTRVARRTDGTVKGRLSTTVIGSLAPWNKSADDGTQYGTRREHHDAAHAALVADGWTQGPGEWQLLRWGTAEALSRTNVYLHATGEYIRLIGTEVGAWSQVIEHEPTTVDLGDTLTVNGARVGTYVLAPHAESYYPNTYERSASIAGSTETAKRRTGWQRTAVSCEQRPAEVTYLPMWTAHGMAYRVVKRYRTRAPLLAGEWSPDLRSATVRSREPLSERRASVPSATHIGGKHGWMQPAPRRTRAQRDANVRTLSKADATELVAATMADAIRSKAPTATITVRTAEGYRITATLARDARAVRVAVSHAGHAERRTVRSAAGVRSTIERLAS